MHEADYVPRLGEVLLIAPYLLIEEYPVAEWTVYRVQHMLDNEGRLGLPTIFLRPFDEEKDTGARR